MCHRLQGSTFGRKIYINICHTAVNGRLQMQQARTRSSTCHVQGIGQLKGGVLAFRSCWQEATALNGMSVLQEFGISEEGTFATGPAPGSEETVKLLAIADLGFCEEDGSMTYAGNYPNPIATLPVGTPAEIRQEVDPPSTWCMLWVFKTTHSCCRGKEASVR